MALVLANRVRETSTTTGTGTITLAGAVTGYQTFSAGIGANNTCYYTISNPGVAEWEVGLGTVGSPATTLARTTILASSNAGSAVNFSAGTKDVFVTYPSSKSVYLDASGNASALGTPASGTVTNLTGTASININGTVGATTPNTGAFTTGSFSGAISVTAAATSTFRNDQNTDTAVYIRNDSAGAAATARFDLFTGTALASALSLYSFGPGYTGSYAGVNYANLRMILDNAAAANSNGLMLASSFKNVYIASAGTLVGTFSSTGLAVTGTFSASGRSTFSSAGPVGNDVLIGTSSGLITSGAALGVNGPASGNAVEVKNSGSTNPTLNLWNTTADGQELAFYDTAGTKRGYAYIKNSTAALRFADAFGIGFDNNVDITGTLGLTGSAATETKSFSAGGTTTSANYWQISNTGGNLYIGVDNYSGVALITGGTAYGSVIGTNNNTTLHLISNGTSIAQVTSTGLAVTGTLSSTGAATLSNGATISATSGALGIKLIGRAADNVSNLLFYKNDGTTLVGDITNTNSAINVEVGSVVGSFTSTGLAVTGTLSATGLITKTNSAATQSQFLAVSGSTTAATYADITNTTGALRIGIESSAGGILATGTSAYASVVSSNSATALQLCGGGIIGVSIASTGITTIPKRLVVTGSDNATLASFTNSNNSGNVVGDFINSAATSTNQYGVRATLSGDPNSTGTYFFNCLGNITERGTWRGNGGIANYQANDVNLSDMSIKTDFHAYDSNMIWDFGKRMKGAWGRFKYDDQTHDDWNNGYGAQLVRDAAGSDFPELVEETDWRGKGNVLTVYDSDLMHIMGAVTTEAQHRIEEQEARIARLEAALAKAGISLQ